MPAATEYAPEDEKLLSEASTELKTRQEVIQSAWAYFHGDHKIQLKGKKDKKDRTVVSNLYKQAVNRIVSFLVPQFPILKLDDTGDSANDQWLKEAWQENKAAILLSKLAMNGCMAGHVYAKLMETPADREYPRVIAWNPANVVTFWQADDIEQVLWYSFYWADTKYRHRQDIVNEGGSWGIYEYQSKQDQQSLMGQAMPEPKPEDVNWQLVHDSEWKYPLSPVVDWQHLVAPNQFYGESEFENIALNDNVNGVRSDSRQILRIHAAPRTIGTGVESADVQESAIDSFWTVKNPDAKIYNLEMKGDLTASQMMAENLRNEYFAERRVVVLRGDVKDLQRVTNLGVAILYSDQLAKNEELRRQYEIGLQEISRRMRMLGGYKDYKARPKVVWFSPLPSDPLEELQVVQGKRQLGVISERTATDELHEDWQLEQDRKAEESATNDGMMERIMSGGISTPLSPTLSPTQGGKGANTNTDEGVDQ